MLPPNSSKLNGYVKRAHLTHTQEFYEVTDSLFSIAKLNSELLVWERVYNAVRPHQSLGYLTPQEFLECYKQNKRRTCVTKVVNGEGFFNLC